MILSVLSTIVEIIYKVLTSPQCIYILHISTIVEIIYKVLTLIFCKGSDIFLIYK